MSRKWTENRALAALVLIAAVWLSIWIRPPSSAGMAPARMRISVDFPAPFSPIRA